MSLHSENAKGFQYDPDLVLAEGEEINVETWKDLAECHGMTYLYDLNTNKAQTRSERQSMFAENRYKLATARPICFRCPVFEECWNDAYDQDDVGVIRAGALLNSEIKALRVKRLVVAWDAYQRYKEKKNE